MLDIRKEALLAGKNGIVLPPGDENAMTESVYHMFVIRLDSNDLREGLSRALREEGIETGVHYPVPKPASSEAAVPRVAIPPGPDETAT